MRKILFIILLPLVFLFSCTSNNLPKEKMEDSVYIIEVPNTSKDALWDRANSWCVEAFKNSTNVVQFSDKEAGVLRGKFTGEYNGYYYQYVQTTFSIEVKDGKARLRFYDPLRIILGDIMIGAYYKTEEKPVYTSDTKLASQVLDDWNTLANYFEKKLESTYDEDW